MNEFEKRVLTRLQKGIPVTERPYLTLASELATDEKSLIDMVKRFKEEGYIREISPVFETERMGYSSTLVACEVSPDSVDHVAGLIGEHPGVTHNYLRDNRVNLWFTLTLPEEVSKEKTISSLERISEGRIIRSMNLSRLKTYKIRVAFDLSGNDVVSEPDVKKSSEHGSKSPRTYVRGSSGEIPSRTAALRGRLHPALPVEGATQAPIKKIDRKTMGSVVDILQDGLPLTTTPFFDLAKAIGMKGEDFLRSVSEMISTGVIRRFPAMLRHQKIGFTANWLVAWKLAEDCIDKTGEEFAKFPFITHCYRRRRERGWEWDLYTMTHARNENEASENLELLRKIAKNAPHLVMKSLKEYKKVRVRYFSRDLYDWNEKYGV